MTPTTITYFTAAHKNVQSIIARGDLAVKTFKDEHDLDFILKQIANPQLDRATYSRYQQVLKRPPPKKRQKIDPLTGRVYEYVRHDQKTNTHTKKTSITLLPAQTKLMSLFGQKYIGCAFDINDCEHKNYIFRENATSNTYFWCADSSPRNFSRHPFSISLAELKKNNQQLNGYYPIFHNELIFGLPERRLAALFIQQNRREERLALLNKMYQVKALFQQTTDIPMWLLQTRGSFLSVANKPCYGPYTILQQLDDLLLEPNVCSTFSIAFIEQVIGSALETLIELQAQLSPSEVRCIIDKLVQLNRVYGRNHYEGLTDINCQQLALQSEHMEWIVRFSSLKSMLTPARLWSMFETQQWGVLSFVLHDPSLKEHLNAVALEGLNQLPLFNVQYLYLCAQHKQWNLFAPIIPLITCYHENQRELLSAFFIENCDVFPEPTVALFFNHSWDDINSIEQVRLITKLIKHCRGEFMDQLGHSSRFQAFFELQTFDARVEFSWNLIEFDQQALFLAILQKQNLDIKLPEEYIKRLLQKDGYGPYLEGYLIRYPDAYDIQGVRYALLLHYVKTAMFSKAKMMLMHWSTAPLLLDEVKSVDKLTINQTRLIKDRRNFQFELMKLCRQWNYRLEFIDDYLHDLDGVNLLLQFSEYDGDIKTLLSQKSRLLSLPENVFLVLWEHKKIQLDDISIEQLVNEKSFMVEVILRAMNTADSLWLKILAYSLEKNTLIEAGLVSVFLMNAIQKPSISVLKKLLTSFMQYSDFQRVVLSHIPQKDMDSNCQIIALLLNEKKYTPSQMIDDLQKVSLDLQKRYFSESSRASSLLRSCFKQNETALMITAASVIADKTIIQFCTVNSDSIENSRRLGQLVFQARLNQISTATEVFALLRQFRELDASCKGVFFERQRFLKFSFWGHRCGDESMSRTGAEFYKLAKNRLLELARESKITEAEEGSVEALLAKHRDRFGVFETASLKTFRSLKNYPPLMP